MSEDANTQSVWCQFEVDGELEEAELLLEPSALIKDVRETVVAQRVFRLPPGATAASLEVGKSAGTINTFTALSDDRAVRDLGLKAQDSLMLRYKVDEDSGGARLDAAAVTTSAQPLWLNMADALRTAERAMRLQWDTETAQWDKTAVLVTVDADAFGSGAKTRAHHLRDLSDTRCSYVAKFGADGAKVSKEEMMEIAKMRAIVQSYVVKFSEQANCDVRVLNARVFELTSRKGDDAYCLVEEFIEKKADAVAIDDSNARGAALAHFVYEQSGRALAISDVKALDADLSLLVYCALHSADGKDYGDHNKGEEGIRAFYAAHRCNEVCASLGLDAIDPAQSAAADVVGQVRKNAAAPSVSRALHVVRLAPADGEDSPKSYDLGDVSNVGVIKVIKEHRSFVSALCVGEKLIISGSGDKTIRCWDKSTFACVKTLEGHRGDVTSLWLEEAAEAGATTLFSSSTDSTVKCWSLDGDAAACTSSLVHRDDVWGVVRVLDYVATVAGKNVLVWERKDDKWVQKTELKGHKKVTKAIAARGDYVFSGSNDKTIIIWDLTDMEAKYTLTDHTGWIKCLHVDGLRLYSGSQDTNCKVWNLETLECEHTLTGAKKVESLGTWNGMLFCNYEDGRSKVFSEDGSEAIGNLKEHSLAVLSFAARGAHFVTGSFDSSLRVWAAML